MGSKLSGLILVPLLLGMLLTGCKGENKQPETAQPAVPQEEAAAPAQAPQTAPEATVAPAPQASNQPPAIVNVRIAPDPARGDTDITVEPQAEDPEGDAITYEYQWLKAPAGGTIGEAEELAGETKATLSHEKFARGELVAVKVTPTDWYGRGKPFQTEAIMINNSPPRIVSTPPAGLAQGNLYQYQVQAQDPDDDPLTFALGEGAPEGMTIDAKSGLLSWTVDPGKPVNTLFTIKADDGHEGFCTQQMTLDLEVKPPTPGKIQ